MNLDRTKLFCGDCLELLPLHVEKGSVSVIVTSPPSATFQVKLAEMCMRLHGVSRIRLAMDPFSGLGSSSVAAKSLGVPFIEFSRKRISEA